MEVHPETGACQLAPYVPEAERAVVHDERRPPQRVAHPHHRVEAQQHPVAERARAGRGDQRKCEAAARPQDRSDLREQGGQLTGEEVPEGPEADHQVEGGREGQGAGVRPDPGDRRPRRPDLLPCDVEHARAEVDAGDPLPAHPRQHADARAGAAAQVEAGAEGSHAPQCRPDGVEDRVGCPEGSVVELRREEVVAALDGRQRLDGELAQRGTFGAEHRLSLGELAVRGP